jgi:DNA-directed RNA polymerase subunit RPC12/RpoP
MVTPGSHKRVWWLGRCGHEWQARVFNRSKGSGCPVCAGKEVLVGFNDLSTTYPKLAAEWHPTKNGGLTPQDVTCGSNKNVWWLCRKCGHEWPAIIADRSKGNGCPFCAGRKIVKGVNDLKTTHPEFAAEWHPTLNKNLTPRDITIEYDRRIWWCCAKCGRTFRFAPFERIEGRGCYFCPKKQS